MAARPSYLKTVSMATLYDIVSDIQPPLIDGLLQRGTYLFVGSPKVGKSFMMAQPYEKTGISYTLYGDYYLPDLALPAEKEKPIGIWGENIWIISKSISGLFISIC